MGTTGHLAFRSDVAAARHGRWHTGETTGPAAARVADAVQEVRTSMIHTTPVATARSVATTVRQATR